MDAMRARIPAPKTAWRSSSLRIAARSSGGRMSLKPKSRSGCSSCRRFRRKIWFRSRVVVECAMRDLRVAGMCPTQTQLQRPEVFFPDQVSTPSTHCWVLHMSNSQHFMYKYLVRRHLQAQEPPFGSDPIRLPVLFIISVPLRRRGPRAACGSSPSSYQGAWRSASRGGGVPDSSHRQCRA